MANGAQPINANNDQQRLVRTAARALGNAGLAHAYGHCSARLNDQYMLVCAAKPMRDIKPGEPGTVVPISGELPDGILGEVRIHRAIYRARPDVHGVCRSMPKSIMALSTLRRTPRILQGFATYFSPKVPLWDDPQLIRDDERAQQLAATLNQSKAIVMRGNGLVTAGTDLMRAVVWTWYLESCAELELNILATGEAPVEISAGESAQRATEKGLIVERMWSYLTRGDPEC